MIPRHSALALRLILLGAERHPSRRRERWCARTESVIGLCRITAATDRGCRAKIVNSGRTPRNAPAWPVACSVLDEYMERVELGRRATAKGRNHASNSVTGSWNRPHRYCCRKHLGNPSSRGQRLGRTLTVQPLAHVGSPEVCSRPHRLIPTCDLDYLVTRQQM